MFKKKPPSGCEKRKRKEKQKLSTSKLTKIIGFLKNSTSSLNIKHSHGLKKNIKNSMDRFFDMESPPCEHVLVKTIKLTRKCEKCRQFKWPWSKAVGCIKCRNIWHRRCGSFEREVDECVVQPCTVRQTPVAEIEKDSSIVGMARVAKTFLKHPCRWIRRKANRVRVAGVAQQLNGQSLLATSSDSCPTIARPIESLEAEDAAITPEAQQPLTVGPIVMPEKENAGSTRTITLYAQLLNNYLATVPEADKAVTPRVITLDEQPLNVFPIVMPEKEIAGSTRSITLYAQLLNNYLATVPETDNAVTPRGIKLDAWPATFHPISHSFKWPKPIDIGMYPERYIAQRSSQSELVKCPRSENVSFSARAVQCKNVAQVNEKIENSVVTADPIIGTFSSFNRRFQRSNGKLTVTGVEELYRQLLPAVTVDSWPLPIVLKKTIQPTVFMITATVGATLINVFKAPLEIIRKPLSILPLTVAGKALTVTPSTTITVSLAITAAPPAKTVAPLNMTAASPAITAASSTKTVASPTITVAPKASPNNNFCHRPNCKNRRCRRRQMIAAARTTNSNS